MERAGSALRIAILTPHYVITRIIHLITALSNCFFSYRVSMHVCMLQNRFGSALLVSSELASW